MRPGVARLALWNFTLRLGRDVPMIGSEPAGTADELEVPHVISVENHVPQGDVFHGDAAARRVLDANSLIPGSRGFDRRYLKDRLLRTQSRGQNYKEAGRQNGF